MRLTINGVITGDALMTLRGMPSATVDTAVTSPPYFAVRDYDVRGQFGLEENIKAWVDHLVAVADEVARLLKPTGSFWLNVGDSYSRSSRFGTPPKSLLLGPERLLLALAKRDWIVRNKVVWTKPNAMPTSATDRLACTWEPMYLLVRSTTYYFDLDALRLPHRSRATPSRAAIPTERAPWAGPLAGDQSGLARLKAAGLAGHPLGKNPGDTWTLSTSSFRSEHHATFPEALVERPMQATCPERVCGGCGVPWRRRPVTRQLGHLAVLGDLRPGCRCAAAWAPGIVLDPFMGSGTTAVVAERLGRRWIGIELNPAFVDVTNRRVEAARQRQQARAA